nr:MAG TPA: hypothetical protein [Caudoviricetes sp.]
MTHSAGSAQGKTAAPALSTPKARRAAASS